MKRVPLRQLFSYADGYACAVSLYFTDANCELLRFSFILPSLPVCGATLSSFLSSPFSLCCSWFRLDVFLMFIGAVCAMCFGTSMPLFSFLLGEAIDGFSKGKGAFLHACVPLFVSYLYLLSLVISLYMNLRSSSFLSRSLSLCRCCYYGDQSSSIVLSIFRCRCIHHVMLAERFLDDSSGMHVHALLLLTAVDTLLFLL